MNVSPLGTLSLVQMTQYGKAMSFFFFPHCKNIWLYPCLILHLSRLGGGDVDHPVQCLVSFFGASGKGVLVRIGSVLLPHLVIISLTCQQTRLSVPIRPSPISVTSVFTGNSSPGIVSSPISINRNHHWAHHPLLRQYRAYDALRRIACI